MNAVLKRESEGLLNEALEEYEKKGDHGSMVSDISLVKHPNRRNGCEEILTRLAIRDATGNLRNEVSCSEPLSFDIEFCSAHPRQGLCPPHHTLIGFAAPRSARDGRYTHKMHNISFK